VDGGSASRTEGGASAVEEGAAVVAVFKAAGSSVVVGVAVVVFDVLEPTKASRERKDGCAAEIVS
jgi:hypothetical protein